MKKIVIFNLFMVLSAVFIFSADKTYGPNALIIPMDTDYQDSGILLAYGLVYKLLQNGIPVDWVILPGKNYGDVDFYSTGVDLQSGSNINNHGYRGGPFVIDSAYYSQALPIIQSWQGLYSSVKVHRVTAQFTANLARDLTAAPTIAIFGDGNEDIAFKYLNAAKIPQSNGTAWPSKKDNTGDYPCPGQNCCPDCLNESEISGPTTTSHTDGALFDSKGIPKYCQFMSMHYRNPPPSPEVVPEVRSFLNYPTHFFAECQAVDSFEDNSNGHFLTSNGLNAGSNSGNNVARYQADDPFAQADGGYDNPGGSEPSYGLASGSLYYDINVVMLSKQGQPIGVQDVWMNGYLDGNSSKGKVSYLGGHRYEVTLPISTNTLTQGTRYFLNSLFEAPCSSASEGGANTATSVSGPATTNNPQITVDVCYQNSGPGIAYYSSLTLFLPAGATFVSASDGGILVGNTVIWDLGSLPPVASGCPTVVVSFGAEGAYSFSSNLTYQIGLNPQSVYGGPFSVIYSAVSLLRYGGIIGISPQSPPNSSIFIQQYPLDPALDPSRDMEVAGFISGSTFSHEISDLDTSSPLLVFYELQGNPSDTLRVIISENKIAITY